MMKTLWRNLMKGFSGDGHRRGRTRCNSLQQPQDAIAPQSVTIKRTLHGLGDSALRLAINRDFTS